VSLIEVRNKLYKVNGGDVPVRWGSYDFRKDVAAIPHSVVREALEQTGVMYVPTADPKIRVSHLLQPNLQGYSALHEELCMNQHVADCTDVEEMVLDSIEDADIRSDFTAARLRMFAALCIMDSSNEQIAATQQLLIQRSASS
jgi:hypothetical protein